MKNAKRKFGDKKDGRLVRNNELDTNHFIMPFIWPKRTDNEAFISEIFDLTNVNKYLEEKNKNHPEYKYSLFMFLTACLGKMVINRPKMNRFYRNHRLYERNEISVGFIVKKTIHDDAPEALARIIIKEDDTFEILAQKMVDEINARRSDDMDKTSDDIRILMKFPRFVTALVVKFMLWWDRHFVVPKSMSASDMFFTSIAISNLGSVGLHSGYHHLSNWGTNSFFVTIGQKKQRVFYNEKNKPELRDSIDLGMTIDERIADGIYYSKSVRLFKKYIENPWLLDKPFKENK